MALGVFGGGMDGIYSAFIVDFFGSKIFAAVFGYGNLIIYSITVPTTILEGKHFVSVYLLAWLKFTFDQK